MRVLLCMRVRKPGKECVCVCIHACICGKAKERGHSCIGVYRLRKKVLYMSVDMWPRKEGAGVYVYV